MVPADDAAGPDRGSAPGQGAAAPGPAVAAARITLIGRPGCHLCDDARAVISRVAADTGTQWHELSIDDDPSLAERYWEHIPVVLVDGEQHDFWRVDERRLREALRGRRRWFGARHRTAGGPSA